MTATPSAAIRPRHYDEDALRGMDPATLRALAGVCRDYVQAVEREIKEAARERDLQTRQLNIIGEIIYDKENPRP